MSASYYQQPLFLTKREKSSGPEILEDNETIAKAQRRGQVLSLLNQQRSPNEICSALQTDLASVLQDINFIHKELFAKYKDDLPVLKARIIETYFEINREAWTEWERSKHGKKKKRKRKGSSFKGAYDEELTETTGTLGDPRYLEIISGNMEKLERLTGLVEQAKVNIIQNNMYQNINTLAPSRVRMDPAYNKFLGPGEAQDAEIVDDFGKLDKLIDDN